MHLLKELTGLQNDTLTRSLPRFQKIFLLENTNWIRNFSGHFMLEEIYDGL